MVSHTILVLVSIPLAFLISITLDVAFVATDLIITRAKGVEQAVYAQFGNTNGEYKGKIRSLFVNLKDKGNPSLRENIVSGELSPEKFSKMSSEVRLSFRLSWLCH